jgi:hypothetical protein
VALVATVVPGCGGGDDDGTTVVVRSLPDTPDVKPGPLEGVWLRVGDETSRTDGKGEARFRVRTGRVTVCELGTSERPASRIQTCLDEPVPAGSRIELRFSDIGLSLET